MGAACLLRSDLSVPSCEEGRLYPGVQLLGRGWGLSEQRELCGEGGLRAAVGGTDSDITSSSLLLPTQPRSGCPYCPYCPAAMDTSPALPVLSRQPVCSPRALPRRAALSDPLDIRCDVQTYFTNFSQRPHFLHEAK